MNQLIVEHVRCFRERQQLPLRPLTLLVGENSTGKTTFLALARLAWKLAAGPITPDFNQEPFPLGAFEQIAHFHGGQGKRFKSFRIGLEMEIADTQGELNGRNNRCFSLLAEFDERASQPSLNTWLCDLAGTTIQARRTEHEQKLYAVTVDDTAAGGKRAQLSIASPLEELSRKSGFLHFVLSVAARDLAIGERRQPHDRLASFNRRRSLRVLTDQVLTQLGEQPIALAPIRSKPRRTYDPVRDVPDPAGDHIPMVMANLAADNELAWKDLSRRLHELGTQTGLFNKITVVRKGRSGSDPFQVQVQIDRNAHNLVDVGYGVSQVLPILVDCLLAKPGSLFLLQQPEVHLHPRAQAELGTFLGGLIRDGRKQFLIETHSDFLIDRICMDVRDRKTVRPEDVVILYFERDGKSVRVHPIAVDEQGELVEAPSSYREFFRREQRRFLGA